MHAAIRVISSAALVAGLAACSGEPAQPVAPPAELGPFAVGHLAFTAVDPAREDRSILVDVWYPAEGEGLTDYPMTEYPLLASVGLESDVAHDEVPASARQGQTLLVFSHGYGGINTQSIELMENLASHGFVVASPEHTGNAQSSMTDTFDEAASRRVPDVSFVIDTMLDRARDSEDPFHDRLDPERVGVVGHSFGGMTAVGSAAGWAGADPDPRVAAIAPISAVIDGDLQGDTRTGPNAGFTAEQLASIEVPVLLLGGTEDTSVPIENNEIAFEQMTGAPVVYMVDVIGANHTHFANICAIGDLLLDFEITIDMWPTYGAAALVEPYEATCTPEVFPIEEASRLQSLYVTAFFRRHLHGERGYDEYLSETYAEDEPAIRFAVRR